MSDHADIVRERVSHIARGCRAGTSHNPAVYENDIAAALDALVAERDEVQLRAGVNGLGSEPSDAGGPGKEEEYWQRRKLGAAIRHMRDLEDYFRLAGGVDESPNMIRADRARAIYEQISDDYLNGKTTRPTMKERAEAAEAERERLKGNAEAAQERMRLELVRVDAEAARLREALEQIVLAEDGYGDEKRIARAALPREDA